MPLACSGFPQDYSSPSFRGRGQQAVLISTPIERERPHKWRNLFFASCFAYTQPKPQLIVTGRNWVRRELGDRDSAPELVSLLLRQCCCCSCGSLKRLPMTMLKTLSCPCRSVSSCDDLNGKLKISIRRKHAINSSVVIFPRSRVALRIFCYNKRSSSRGTGWSRWMGEQETLTNLSVQGRPQVLK